MSSKDGSITQLPARFKRPWGSTRKEEVKHVAPSASPAESEQNKLAALRSKRVVGFFRAKARRRAGAQALASVVRSSNGAVLTLLRSLSHLAAGFFSRKRQSLTALIGRESKWRRKLRLLPSVLMGEKSVLSMIQNTLRRTFRLGADKKTQAERERRQHQVRIYQWVCRALARLGRSAISAARKRYRAEGAALLSREMVHGLLDEELPLLAVKFVAMREHERRAKNAQVIQRMWRRVKRSEQASLDAKARILDVLTSLPSRLRQQRETQQQTIKTVHDASSSATRLFIHRAAQRLAARVIQRVWRGHRARARVRRLRDWRMKKFLRRRQRERLRDARTALLMPSEVEQRYRQELETRMLARQQETPLLPVPRRDESRHYQRRRGERATLLEPLPLQSRPPHISSTTRTKVQCFPFSRFEKIIAQDARVNLRNVWVAIPVGHQEQEEETGSRHGGLSPLLVGKGRLKRNKGGLQTTYDWVPAHLLQSQEEREAAKIRRRKRATSPSVVKHILEF